MNDNEIDIDTEPDSGGSHRHIKTSRKAFSNIAIELTDEDLESKGVQKLLLSEISRLESAALQIDNFREKFHSSDKECAVLNEQKKNITFSEILYSVSLTLGAALIGLTPSLKSSSISPNWIGGIGGILIIGAIVAKVVKR